MYISTYIYMLPLDPICIRGGRKSTPWLMTHIFYFFCQKSLTPAKSSTRLQREPTNLTQYVCVTSIYKTSIYVYWAKFYIYIYIYIPSFPISGELFFFNHRGRCHSRVCGFFFLRFLCLETYVCMYIYIYIYIYMYIYIYILIRTHTYGNTPGSCCSCCTTHFFVLQQTATHCNTLQHTTTHCSTPQHTATHGLLEVVLCTSLLPHTATRCNTLQHTATHGLFEVVLSHDTFLCTSLLQHTATHCNTLQHTAAPHDTLYEPTTYCNTLQHPLPHCNTLQHTVYLKKIFPRKRFVLPSNYRTTRCMSRLHTATHCNTLQHTATHSLLEKKIS